MTYAETLQSEKLYTRLGRRYDRVFERAILAEARLTEIAQQHANGRSVLDLACGNGRWLERLAPRDYVGLDLNQALLGQARRRFPSDTFLCADMSWLPFADASFEVVLSMFGAMGHLPPEGQRAMISEVHRVLIPGGVAIFTNGNMWSPFNLPNTLRGNRIRLEGVRFKVHSTNPRRFREQLSPFCVLQLEAYDYSYIPLLPLKLGVSLAGRDWQTAYSELMGIFEHCRHVPRLRWFGKQLFAVVRKEENAA